MSHAFDKRRVLAIGLDGYELSLAEEMMDEGLLPHMRELRSRGARFDLDHGDARLSGLAWEHVSIGKSPEAMRRWSAVDFDGAAYRAVQAPTSARPFLASLESKAVVLDLPYCDLFQAPNVFGLTTWGAHDPGVAQLSRPPGLHDEMEKLFGPYPATEHIYGFTWPSAENTRKAGEALRRAAEVRGQAALWLLRERIPDWDLALLVVSEAHSAIEQMWHGIDPRHDLRDVPSAVNARAALRSIYAAIDQLIGALAAAFPDAHLVVWSMHGMGSNNADVPAMVLLGELLYRKQFGKPYMESSPWRKAPATGAPLLAEGEQWHFVMEALIPPLWEYRSPGEGIGADFLYREEHAAEIEWMPVTRYRPFWPQMRAFAIPAFYDGRIRLNVAGRESRGIVPEEGYLECIEEVKRVLAECREIRTGEPVVSEMSAPRRNPFEVGPTEADLYVSWAGTPVGFRHPVLGEIGPVPHRRTGGHTNPRGFAYFAGEGWPSGHFGLRDSLDIVPTLAKLLGDDSVAGELSGTPIDPGSLPSQGAQKPGQVLEARAGIEPA